MQNTWLKVIQNMDTIREIPRERLSFWLIFIVKNEAISTLRQQKERFQCYLLSFGGV